MSSITQATLSVDRICDELDLGRTKVYALIGSGELRAIKIGRLTRITVEELNRFIATRPKYRPSYSTVISPSSATSPDDAVEQTDDPLRA